MSGRLWVATRKGLFSFVEQAHHWHVERTQFLGDPVGIVHQDPRDGAIYAALEHGHFGAKLHRSRDGGRSFEEIAVPVYPPRPEGEEDLDPVRKQPVPWKLGRIWSIAHGHASQPGRLWAGTIPGALFRSDDHGDSWQIVESLWFSPERKRWFGGGADHPAIHSVCVHPQDGDQVWVGVSCGGVWYTADSGATWEVRSQGMRAEFLPPDQAYDPVLQDPHSIVQCRDFPDHLWCQHHNGIFHTNDGGREWKEVKAPISSFGFAVAVHPRHPERAWFVPAAKDEKRIPVDGAVVVTRTRDSGASFEVLREGLPQEHAYDLVLRHAMDVDSQGVRLAFGSTTGSLWLSEDAGESFRTLSTHLPPIYAVEFGTEP